MRNIFILLFIFSTPIQALEYNSNCTGNQGRISISLYTNNKRLFLKYNNLLGHDDFPLYEGVVTKMSLPFIKLAQDQLASLDQEVLVSWPIEKCQFNSQDPLLVQCGGEAEFLYPKNTNLASYTFITSRVTEENINAKYEVFKIRWGIDSPSFHHSLALPFDPSLCQAKLDP